MNFHLEGFYNINNTRVYIQKINCFDEISVTETKIILLEGVLFSDGKRVTSGSFIELNSQHTILSDNITILCLSNIDHGCLKKIIHSKNHLIDYLILNNVKTQTLGLTCGCFDIIHDGHTKNLKTCKKHCDILAVCLSSDEQIKRLKGSTRPINSITDRVGMLINFDFVDLVILYDETNDALETELDNIMNIINPDIWFKGTDYTKDDIIRKHPSLKKIVLVDIIQGKSSTNIIKKIKA